MHSCVPWDMPNCQNNWFFSNWWLFTLETYHILRGRFNFFLYLFTHPRKKDAKSMKVWFAHHKFVHPPFFSVIYVLWRRAISSSHFYPIKACNVRRDYCKCTNCSVCSCWKHWFWKNLLIRQLSTAVLLSWERWLYLWPDFRLSEQ